MTGQELKECIAEVKHSDMPEASKKKVMNVLYEQMHEKVRRKRQGRVCGIGDSTM